MTQVKHTGVTSNIFAISFRTMKTTVFGFILLYIVQIYGYPTLGGLGHSISQSDINYEQIAKDLPIDTAAVSFLNLVNSSSLQVFFRLSVCYHCVYQPVGVIPSQQVLGDILNDVSRIIGPILHQILQLSFRYLHQTIITAHSISQNRLESMAFILL